jgi:hypothetical protein
MARHEANRHEAHADRLNLELAIERFLAVARMEAGPDAEVDAINNRGRMTVGEDDQQDAGMVTIGTVRCTPLLRMGRVRTRRARRLWPRHPEVGGELEQQTMSDRQIEQFGQRGYF